MAPGAQHSGACIRGKAMKGLLLALATMAMIGGGLAEAMAQRQTCTTTCQNNTGGGKTCTRTCY
jgi:hypothetical protein